MRARAAALSAAVSARVTASMRTATGSGAPVRAAHQSAMICSPQLDGASGGVDPAVGGVRGEGVLGFPARIWRSAWCSHGSTWRRLSVSAAAPRSRARAANSPPASISGSWAGSPTATSFAPSRAARSSRRARVRVPTIPASSTISTARGPRPVGCPVSGSVRAASVSSRVIEVAGMPAPSAELAGGGGGQRAPDDPVPGGAPPVGGGPQRGGLARAGVPDDNVDPGPGGQQARGPSRSARRSASRRRITPGPPGRARRARRRRRGGRGPRPARRSRPRAGPRWSSSAPPRWPRAGSRPATGPRRRHRPPRPCRPRAGLGSRPAGSAAHTARSTVAAVERGTVQRQPGRPGQAGDQVAPARPGRGGGVDRRGAARR